MAKNQEVKNETAEEVVSKEEYEKLRAEFEAFKASKEVATEDSTVKKSKELMKEKAIFKAPRNSMSDEEVFVCINGQPMRLKRGVDVEIPKAFAMVLEQSQRQQEYALDYAMGMAENS